MSVLSKLLHYMQNGRKATEDFEPSAAFYDDEEDYELEGKEPDMVWDELQPASVELLPEPEEYEIVEREILPQKIICPDCGGITLEGLEFCDKCGGELL